MEMNNSLKVRNGSECPVQISVGNVFLDGDMCIPERAQGIVLFAHGSGSSRLSPRNRYVSQVLRSEGLGTLLFDLLTREEESLDMLTGHLRFNIRLLADRLLQATQWLRKNHDTARLRMGYFGASTGAAAALVAAAEHPAGVSAIVSRGGRPDLAAEALPQVKAPTLLIVGGRDLQVIDLNREALSRLSSVKEMIIIPGATHLFEEPGALEEVARYARDWFVRYLVSKVR